MTWIRDNPNQFARLTVRRACFFLIFPGNLWHSKEPEYWLRPRIYAILGICTLLELFRLLWIHHRMGTLLVCTLLGVSLPYFITHVEMRYRLPIVSLSALLSCNLAITTGRWIIGKLRQTQPVGGHGQSKVSESIIHPRPPVF
jgi:hypothetical protein